MKPAIAITCALHSAGADSPKNQLVRNSYVEAVLAAGGVPFLIPVVTDPEQVCPLLDHAQGLVLPGGGDIDPSFYGEEPHPLTAKVCILRDKLECLLLKAALAKRLPTLGICRGVQLMNVALGGSLYQDLPSQGFVEIQHNLESDSNYWKKIAHTIKIEEKSLLKEIVQVNELPVNSLHHQAIKACSPLLRPVATAPDGVIEAVELKNDSESPFFLGIQGHPEGIWQDVEPRWAEVFKAFVRAASSGR